MKKITRKEMKSFDQGGAANDPRIDGPMDPLITNRDPDDSDDRSLGNAPDVAKVDVNTNPFQQIDAWNLVPKGNSKVDSDLACPKGLITDHQIVDVVGLLLDAPDDMPDRNDAIQGLCTALGALEIEIPSVKSLRVNILERWSTLDATAANDASVVPLARRRALHLTYSLAREIGFAIINRRNLDRELLALFGYQCVRMLLSDYQPSTGSTAKLRNALLFENVKQAKPWTNKGRALALNKARVGLNDALTKNQRGAQDFGLASTLITQAKPNTQIDIFNAIFRRRVENLIDFATLDAVAAAGGYDTLSPSGLLYAGQQVLKMALTGVRGAVVVALEVVTHLTSEGVLKIPIMRGDSPPARALAWIEVDSGIYSQVLYRIREQGAKVDLGTEHLYEVTTQVVSIHLSPLLHKLLIDMDRATGGVAENVEGLTGAVGHCPRSGVVKGAGYRITARRIQESLPTLLVQEGFHRWPVALATNSHFLVTRGRRAYGACRLESIDKVIDRVYQMLGWPQPTKAYKSELVGTPTVPRDEIISKCLNYLCDRADRLSTAMDTYDGICSALQAHAAWLAMLESLAFALRRWLVYDIKIKNIVNDESVKFNDKDVHEHQGPGVPAVTIMRDAVKGWMRFCDQAIDLLYGLADADSADLAKRLEKYLADENSEIGVVTLDSVGNLKPIGYKTWHDVLPENIRLQANFSRQFWPLKLMDHDVEQVVMDLLMRHQLDCLTPGTSRSVKSLVRSMAILRAAMEAVMGSLNLRVPLMLQGDQDGE